MTVSVVGCRRSSKALPKVKLAPKNVMITFWWSSPLWSTTAFTSEKYAQQINELPWKCTATPGTGIGQQKAPSSPWQLPTVCYTTDLQKLNKLSYGIMSDPPYSPDLSLPDYHFFKHLDNFLQGKHFHNQQEAENAFQEFIGSWSKDFYASGINKPISPWQKNVLLMVPILINKDVLEPSYNDLKFLVWNHNYFCTNLIIKLLKWMIFEFPLSYHHGYICQFY